MTWLLASLVVAAAAPFILWPLIRHWQPGPEPAPPADQRDTRFRELEELELDVASGRLSPQEAERRRAEVQT